MRLNKFQETFKDTMLQPAADLHHVDDDFRDVFVDNDISVEDRLKVYHNNIIGSVSASLCATFPVIEKLVGDDFLKAMARAFIFDTPPTSGCLHTYGTGFDDFIRSYAPAKGLPYLADVATFELAVNAAYYAPDDLAMRPDTLAGVSKDALSDVQIMLRPSVTFIESSYPILAIKHFCENEEKYDAPDLTHSHETRLLVYRPHLEVEIVSLDKDEFFILKQFHSHESLGRALEKTLDIYPAFDFNKFLQKNISLETFSAY